MTAAAPPGATPSLARRMASFVYEGLLLFGIGLIPGAIGALFVALTGHKHPLQGEFALQVKRMDHRAAGHLLIPVLRRYAPHDLELNPVGILGVQRLRHSVVARADQCVALGQPVPHLRQVCQGPDLPGEVLQADIRAVR